MKFILFILLILSLSFLLTGCNSKLSENEFMENHETYLTLANDICISKNMITVGINYNGFYDIKAMCMTRSPINVHEVAIKFD